MAFRPKLIGLGVILALIVSVIYLETSSEKKAKNEFTEYPEDPYAIKKTSFFKDRPEAPRNIVDNSSFELGMKNWEIADFSGEAIWEIDQKEAFHGKRSLKISRKNSSPKTKYTDAVYADAFWGPVCGEVIVIRSQLMPIIKGGGILYPHISGAVKMAAWWR